MSGAYPASTITMVCTGNAARSVMAACLLRDRLGDRDDIEVESAGTLVLPGHPMSVRTRTALERHGLRDPWHRSKQLDADGADRATVLLVMEASHVAWIRRRLPQVAPRAVSLRRAVRDLPAALGETLADRVANLALAELDFEPWEEVLDPGAGEQPDFDACIDDLAGLVDELVAALG